MALDIEQEIIRHRKGWESFSRFLFIGAAGVVVILALMALTLL